jgi:hypothetical protein
VRARLFGRLTGKSKTEQAEPPRPVDAAKTTSEETPSRRSATGAGAAIPDSDAIKAQVAARRQVADALALRVEAGVLAWLAEHGPDDWHAVARSWNWDRGVAPLLWCLDQPDCDRATAALLFWRACPDSVLTSETLEDAQRDRCGDSWQVATAVLDRLDGAGFERAEIALDAEADPPWSRETWERLQDKYGVDAPVPDWMHGPLPGRAIAPRFTEGLPRPMVEWVYPDWPEGWGD